MNKLVDIVKEKWNKHKKKLIPLLMTTSMYGATVGVNLHDKAGEAIGGATGKVMLGETIVAEGTSTPDGNILFTDVPMGIDDPNSPYAFNVGNFFPNPFNPATQIEYANTGSTGGHIAIFDMQGRMIVQGKLPIHSSGNITWGGMNKENKQVASGVYNIVIQAGKKKEYKKITLEGHGNSGLKINSYTGSLGRFLDNEEYRFEFTKDGYVIADTSLYVTQEYQSFSWEGNKIPSLIPTSIQFTEDNEFRQNLQEIIDDDEETDVTVLGNTNLNAYIEDGELVIVPGNGYGGTSELTFTLTNDGITPVIQYQPVTVNEECDLTLNVVNLLGLGREVMNGIESTFQIGNEEYTGFGTITIQIPPGTYEIWAENATSGIFEDGNKLADPHIIIRTPNTEPYLVANIAQRAWGDESSQIIVGTSDLELDLFKFGLNLETYQTMSTIIDGSAPAGIDKYNTPTPNWWVATNCANYGEPTEQTLTYAMQVINEKIGELAPDFLFQPVWMGLGIPPEPNPEGISFGQYNFDTTVSGAGSSVENINNNIIYRSVVYSNPGNILAALMTETAQTLGLRGDLGAGIGGYIISENSEGDLYYNENARICFKLLSFFNKGTNF